MQNFKVIVNKYPENHGVESGLSDNGIGSSDVNPVPGLLRKAPLDEMIWSLPKN